MTNPEETPPGAAATPTDARPEGTPPSNHPTPTLALRTALAGVRTEVGRAVVGQDSAVTSLLIALDRKSVV